MPLTTNLLKQSPSLTKSFRDLSVPKRNLAWKSLVRPARQLHSGVPLVSLTVLPRELLNHTVKVRTHATEVSHRMWTSIRMPPAGVALTELGHSCHR